LVEIAEEITEGEQFDERGRVALAARPIPLAAGRGGDCEFRAGAPRSIGVDGNLVECLGCAVSTVAVVEAVALTVVLMLAVVFMDIAMS
jgi:hypothetical protein